MPRGKTAKRATQTFFEIQQQIAELQAQAERVKQQEVRDVIDRIREAIEAYGLTPDQLFGPSTIGMPKKSAVPHKRSVQSKPKYKDPASDKTWTGHGKRPGWFVQAMAAGKTPQDLAL